MKGYLPKSFQREAKSEGVTEQDCQEAIRKAEKGLIDADLRGGLIKQRIPRSNQGAARGLRAIVFYKRGDIAVFLHLFPKSGKANLMKSELAEYHALAQALERLTDEKLTALADSRGWKEIDI